MSSLPVDAVRADVVAALRERGRVVVGAPTGSGKSTRLPIWLEEEVEGTVLVVEPRRVACRALAGWLASQRGESVGQGVGSWVRFERRVSDATRIVFATPGIALRVLSGDAERFAAVMIDEFHERGWETDLLVARLARGDRPLVVTSATLDQERVAQALDALVVEAEGRRFPLTIEYADAPAEPSPEGLEERIARALRAAWPPPNEGDALVFLPGKGEIRRCAAALSGVAPTIEVHGGVRPDVLAKHFAAPAGGRVFLATNVAETSLTIPGVTLVLDSGLVRRRLHRGGRSVLALDRASLAEMDQRAGRAGRVAPGRVVRLWSARFRPRQALPPEISRIELDDVVLAAAALGDPVHRNDALPWVDVPPEFAWNASVERARGLGALNASGEITAKGRAWTALPVGPAEARLLANAPAALAGTFADLVALLEQRRSLWLPLGGYSDARQADVRAARAALLSDLDDEVRAAVRLLRGGDAERHALDRVVLSDARRTAERLRSAVGAPRLADARPLSDRQTLVRAILERWPEVGYVARERALAARKKRGIAESEPWANAEGELRVRLPSLPWREDAPTPPVAGAVLDLAWLGVGATQVRGVGGFVLPARRADLANAGLGEPEIGPPTWDKRRRRVVAPVRRTMAGVVLREDDEALAGAPLRDALLTLIPQGRVLREAWPALQDAVHAWQIVDAHPDTSSVNPAPAEALDWLRSVVDTIGIEESDDLALVEAEDLVPDVSEQTGVASWDLERLVADFPREWTYLGATYRCVYRFAAGRVTLSPANAAAKKAKEPAKHVLPSFRGFRVFFTKASRTVQLR